MVAYAEWSFYAHGRDDKVQDSRIVIWRRISERRGKQVAQLSDAPKLSDAAAQLWELYVAIKSGCEAVTYEAIDAYSRLIGAKLSPFEVGVMLKIDRARVNAN